MNLSKVLWITKLPATWPPTFPRRVGQLAANFAEMMQHQISHKVLERKVAGHFAGNFSCPMCSSAFDSSSSFLYTRFSMRIPTIILMLAFAPLGCGTVTNLRYPARIDAPEGSTEICEPYGGVILAARAGKEHLTNPISPAHGMTELSPFLALYFWGVDLPMSMIGDTITFPIAAARILKVVRTDGAYDEILQPEKKNGQPDQSSEGKGASG
jgi:hypothetical protein